MLGDIIRIREEYYITAQEIMQTLIHLPNWDNRGLVIGIAGESGSGKSVTAVCLQQELQRKGKNALILHQDDYFRLPPKNNHDARLKNILQVGPGEVYMDLLQSHINAFIKLETTIHTPVVNYKLNQILSEIIPIAAYDILIVEGTYVFELENIHFKIFMDRDYLETKQQRLERARDEQSEFVENVLAIEHKIIRSKKQLANVIIDKNYQVSLNHSKQ